MLNNLKKFDPLLDNIDQKMFKIYRNLDTTTINEFSA